MANTDITQRSQYERSDLLAGGEGIRRGSEKGAAIYIGDRPDRRNRAQRGCGGDDRELGAVARARRDRGLHVRADGRDRPEPRRRAASASKPVVLDQLEEDHLGRVRPARAELDDPRVAAGTLRVARRDLLEQLVDDELVVVRASRERLPAGVQVAALGERDQLLDLGLDRLRLRPGWSGSARARSAASTGSTAATCGEPRRGSACCSSCAVPHRGRSGSDSSRPSPPAGRGRARAGSR